MAYAIKQFGAAPEKDLAELWRRLVFSILISNTDDHLRNHGFLYEGTKGWRLSPAYDINPTPTDIKKRYLSTAIDFTQNEMSLETALSVYPDFMLKKDQALSIIRKTGREAALWRESARALGLSREEIERMASAFDHRDMAEAVKG
jgi:serine/threonine-protein kinase HipA